MPNIRTEIWGEFSFPSNGQNCRGYVSYSAVLDEDNMGTLSSWLNYNHQTKAFLYPVRTAMDHWAGRSLSDGKFDLYQYAFQYDLDENKLFIEMD